MKIFLLVGLLLATSSSFASDLRGSEVLNDTLRQTISSCDVALNINTDTTNVLKAQILKDLSLVPNVRDGFKLVSVMPYPKDPAYCLFTFAKQ